MVVDGHEPEGTEETDACAGDRRWLGQTQSDHNQRTTRKPPENHQKTARNDDQPPEPLPLPNRILALLRQDPSASRREIAATLGTTESTVRYRLDQLRDGQTRSRGSVPTRAATGRCWTTLPPSPIPVPTATPGAPDDGCRRA